MTSLHNPGGADGLEDAPWWVRSGIRVGVPTVFAIILLWFVLGQVSTVLTGLQQTLQTLAGAEATIISNQSLIIQNQASIIHIMQDHENSSTTLQKLVVCLGMARSDTDRNRCLVR